MKLYIIYNMNKNPFAELFIEGEDDNDSYNTTINLDLDNEESTEEYSEASLDNIININNKSKTYDNKPIQIFKNYSNHENKKRILCLNIIQTDYCRHGDRCIYAHSKKEQVKDKSREQAYKMIMNNDNLSDVNLINNKELFYALKTLTKLCLKCENSDCPGGYNCNHGACNKIYQVCYSNLIVGKCNNSDCKNIHLTERGLVPYRLQTNKKKYYTSEKQQKVDINGILLTNSLLKHINKDDTSDSESDSESIKIRNYINNNNYSDDESIFLV